MLISMTGFGRATGERQRTTITVEVRSLNHRFLEIQLQLPRRYYEKEAEIRTLVKRFAIRGKIAIRAIIASEADQLPIRYNLERAHAYYMALQDIQRRLKLRDTPRLDHLLHFPDLFETTETEEMLSEQEWQLFYQVLQDALSAMRTMRQREGEVLTKDVQKRLKTLQQFVRKIEKRSAQRIPEERERLRQRIAQLFENEELDEYRLEMEIALLADKIDVTEECVRLKSHLDYALRLLRTRNTEVGRQLNFLVQEMQREANTIGAKANDAEISQLVVQMKEEIEKVREQVQNAE